MDAVTATPATHARVARCGTRGGRLQHWPRARHHGYGSADVGVLLFWLGGVPSLETVAHETVGGSVLQKAARKGAGVRRRCA